MSYIKKQQHLDSLIFSQQEQEKKGNLSQTGVAYLNGLKSARQIVFGKLFVFKSEVTGKTYSWDGNSVVIIGSVDKSIKGFANSDLEFHYTSNKVKFKIGDAEYSVLKKI